MTNQEILAYALAHAVATLDFPDSVAEARAITLMHAFGERAGIDAVEGEEYQRVILHYCDPERISDMQEGPILQPVTTLKCATNCDICGEHLPAGTPVVCLPDHPRNSDPWGCPECARVAGYRIATSEAEFTASR
jgi:hypothetical protein